MSEKKKVFNQKNFYKIIKSFLDIFLALILSFIGLPFFLFISILIKLSSRGPIFFLQKRIGKNNKPFYCIKFRTMHPEAEDMLKKIMINNKKLREEFQETQKLKNDPRITVIGKFLRKTSLDEIPQFINVLKQEMSIVGPRPIVEEEKYKYGDVLPKVLSVNPGITGLWQVSGRNNLTYEKRVYLDELYVKNFNFLMDIRIIIRTFGVIFFPMDRGAY